MCAILLFRTVPSSSWPSRSHLKIPTASRLHLQYKYHLQYDKLQLRLRGVDHFMESARHRNNLQNLSQGLSTLNCQHHSTSRFAHLTSSITPSTFSVTAADPTYPGFNTVFLNSSGVLVAQHCCFFSIGLRVSLQMASKEPQGGGLTPDSFGLRCQTFFLFSFFGLVLS